MDLTVQQAQFLWDKAKDPTVRDWLFEVLVELGFDVRDDVVTKLA